MRVKGGREEKADREGRTEKREEQRVGVKRGREEKADREGRTEQREERTEESETQDRKK
ncbi:MAG: hypothetical protein ACI4SH_07525 [Candidatus Scatosoma sp.]